MKTNISVLNNYIGYKFNNKNVVKKIIKLLFDMPVVKENSCIFNYDFKQISFDIVFCSDEEIQTVNKEYRGKDVPTDVITFALFADDKNPVVFGDTINLGEIIISVDTAKRQAKITLEDEIELLLTHGILHLLGFDHQNDEDYKLVVGIQDIVMKELRSAKISI